MGSPSVSLVGFMPGVSKTIHCISNDLEMREGKGLFLGGRYSRGRYGLFKGRYSPVTSVMLASLAGTLGVVLPEDV